MGDKIKGYFISYHPDCRCYLRTIMVPAPCSVNNSRSNTCGSLPSTMCTRGTANSALRHAVTLGIIPPLMMPSSIRCSASTSVNSEINDPSVRQMPTTLLKKMSFSALSAPARCAATRSALMFKQVPLCDCAQWRNHGNISLFNQRLYQGGID